MKCPACREEMQQGVLWLGVLSCAAKVLFSPIRGVSWIQRRLAGTGFYNGSSDGEVEILSRGWADNVAERSSFFCRACGILVCRVKSQGTCAAPITNSEQSGTQEASLNSTGYSIEPKTT